MPSLVLSSAAALLKPKVCLNISVSRSLCGNISRTVCTIKQRRESTDSGNKAKLFEMKKEMLALEDALSQSDAQVREGEEYSAQVELRLQAALQWRIQVEAELEAQSGESKMLHQHLSLLKTALDVSPASTPSKGLCLCLYHCPCLCLCHCPCLCLCHRASVDTDKEGTGQEWQW